MDEQVENSTSGFPPFKLTGTFDRDIGAQMQATSDPARCNPEEILTLDAPAHPLREFYDLARLRIHKHDWSLLFSWLKTSTWWQKSQKYAFDWEFKRSRDCGKVLNWFSERTLSLTFSWDPVLAVNYFLVFYSIKKKIDLHRNSIVNILVKSER